MAQYVVKFLKDVLGENGHEAEICQWQGDVQAANMSEAVEKAKQAFCEQDGLRSWSLHADRLQVTENAG